GFVRDAAAAYLRKEGISELKGVEISLTLRESNTTLDLQKDEGFKTALLAQLAH
ncbi:MAG: hypothetical protein ACI87O_003195, partial [Planctomycetota bacterium]